MDLKRLGELQGLACGIDEDVDLLVAAEIAAMPETAAMRMDRLAIEAGETADAFAPIAAPVDAAILDELAEDAGF